MGIFTQMLETQRLAFVLLLGFALAAYVALIYLEGSSIHPPTPETESFGDWVREGYGPVPTYLRLWMVGVAIWAVVITGIVIRHGYWY